MTILFDARVLAKNGTSGIEEYAKNLLQSLSTTGNDRYITFSTGIRSTRFHFHLPVPGKLFDATSRFLRWPAIDRWVKADLAFSPHFNILHTRSIPRVVTFHDLSFLHHPYFFSRKQRIWHWLQDAKRQAENAAAIIAVSEFTKSDLVAHFGIPAEKIRVIYSGIAPIFFETPKEPPSSKPYILYLGTLEPRKNVPAIIRAFSLLKQKPLFRDFRLVLAGRAGWLYGDVAKEVAASPFRGDIALTGPVADSDRPALYRNASLFVYPSFFEGFGFPPLEAQASGCPVIVAERTSLRETLGNSALFINPWNVGELAEAMEEALADAKIRVALSRAGRDNAARFSWERTAEQTRALFYEATA